MGGATAHPTGATLASGDPPVSLNAMGGLESCHSPEAAPRLGLLELVWLTLALAGVCSSVRAGAAVGKVAFLVTEEAPCRPPVLAPVKMEDPPAYKRLDSPAYTGAGGGGIGC